MSLGTYKLGVQVNLKGSAAMPAEPAPPAKTVSFVTSARPAPPVELVVRYSGWLGDACSKARHNFSFRTEAEIASSKPCKPLLNNALVYLASQQKRHVMHTMRLKRRTMTLKVYSVPRTTRNSGLSNPLMW